QHEVGHLAALDDAGCGEDAERDRQIEGCAGLAHVGRRQIDGDLVGRELESRIADRALHAVAALADARVGKADHRGRRQAERDVYFDVDGGGLDTEEGRRTKTREHAARPAKADADQPVCVFKQLRLEALAAIAGSAASRSREYAVSATRPRLSLCVLGVLRMNLRASFRMSGWRVLSPRSPPRCSPTSVSTGEGSAPGGWSRSAP